MTEIHINERGSRYEWVVISRNGKALAQSSDFYNTKFHCKKMAEWLFPTFTIVDKTKDGRRRA